MTNTDIANTRLEMRWLPVTGADGRTRMESTWIEVGVATDQAAAAAQAA